MGLLLQGMCDLREGTALKSYRCDSSITGGFIKLAPEREVQKSKGGKKRADGEFSHPCGGSVLAGKRLYVRQLSCLVCSPKDFVEMAFIYCHRSFGFARLN